MDYGLVTKSLGVGCTFEEMAKKNKLSKDECEIFTTNHLTYFLAGKNP
jgi:hypothetical protein